MPGFLVGMVLGALGGVVAGLLASPRSGKENRELLLEQLPDLKERAPDLMHQVLDQAKARVEEGREAFVEGAQVAREQLTEELQRARHQAPS